jgi:RNA polymerase sigma-70 factor (ECF subfamily)
MSAESDRELEPLVRRAQKGDSQAIGELLRLTQTRLSRFCQFLCHDPQLAQDIAQDSYVRALGELRKLKEPAKFVSWLYKIAKNLFLDHVKSPRNAPTEVLEEEREGEAFELSGADAEFSLHLKQTLALLAPDDRLLLLLVDLEERSYLEAAEIMGISEANVRFRLHHIRKEFINKYES